MPSSMAFFLLEASLSALDGGGETGVPPKLPSLAGVNLSLMNAGFSLLSLLVLPRRWGGDAAGVVLMASQIDVQFLTINAFA